MHPTLVPGDRVLCIPWWGYQPGHLVVAKGETGPMVKRIAKISERGVWLIGDNRERSTDSRDFGWVTANQLLGRVIYRYAPTQRVGWLWTA